MTQVGYAPNSLSCLTCPSPNCMGNCTQKELCEGPQYGYFAPSSANTSTINLSALIFLLLAFFFV